MPRTAGRVLQGRVFFEAYFVAVLYQKTRKIAFFLQLSSIFSTELSMGYQVYTLAPKIAVPKRIILAPSATASL